jgi:hypothetical protein
MIVSLALKASQRVHPGIYDQHDIPALPTKPANRTAPRYVLLPAEMDNACPAVPGRNENIGFVDH